MKVSREKMAEAGRESSRKTGRLFRARGFESVSART